MPKLKFLKILLFIPFFALLIPLILTSKANATEFLSAKGKELRIDEPYHEDMVLTGNSIIIDSPVKGDLVIYAGDVIINSEITGDIYIAAVQVDINAKIDGNVIIAAVQANIKGDIEKDLSSACFYQEVTGNIGDDARLVGQKVIVTSKSIGDNLIVNANEGSVSSETQVNGDDNVNYSSQIKDSTQLKNKLSSTRLTIGILRKVGLIIGWIIAGLLIFKFIPVKSRAVVKNLESFEKTGRSFFVGFLLLLFSPLIVIILSLLTIAGIGQPIAIITLSLLLLSMTIGQIYLLTAFARVVIRYFINKKFEGYILPMSLGIVLFELISWLLNLVPCCGIIIKIIIIFWGVGGIVLTKLDQISFSRKISKK